MQIMQECRNADNADNAENAENTGMQKMQECRKCRINTFVKSLINPSLKKEWIVIKNKHFNILLFMLAFIASATITHGVDAGIDENSIYILNDINKYESSVNKVRISVQNLKAEVDKEKATSQEASKLDYLDKVMQMDTEIRQLKIYNGFTDVRGPGIMIRVADSLSNDETIDIMDKIVHDVDITVLLNDLKSAGAEAIVVNGKRIINISEVVCAGPLLKINGEGVPAPFVISAIGDQDALYAAVTKDGTYAYKLKNDWGMEVATIKSYNLIVPKFFGDNYDIKYAEVTE